MALYRDPVLKRLSSSPTCVAFAPRYYVLVAVGIGRVRMAL